MNRCRTAPPPRSPLPARWLAALLLTTAGLLCSAQDAVREFPKSALRGTLTVTAAPAILLDGHADRLSPGARIRDAQNMLVLSGAIVGQKFAVNYTREAAGMVHEVWILTEAEAALKRPRAPSGSGYGSGSDAPTQVPFDQLPKYPK